MNENPPATPPPVVYWTVWGSLFLSALLYLGILELGLLGDSEEPAPEEASDRTLAVALGLAGLFCGVVSVGVGYVVKNFRDAEGRKKTPAWSFTAFIIAVALAETPAVFGLVLGLVGHGSGDYLPLFVVAVLALLLNRPGVYLPRG